MLSLFPSVQGVATSTLEILNPSALATHILPSIARVALALALSGTIGLPLGFLSSSRHFVGRGVNALVSAVRYVPPPAFIGIIVISLGIGNAAAIALIVLGIAPYIAIMTSDAFRAVPQDFVNVSVTFGASRGEIVTSIAWPYVKPRFIEALRVNVGAAWTLLVISELVAGNNGVGFLIARAQRFLDVDMLFALVLVSGLLGIAFDRLLFLWARRYAWWQLRG